MPVTRMDSLLARPIGEESYQWRQFATAGDMFPRGQ